MNKNLSFILKFVVTIGVISLLYTLVKDDLPQLALSLRTVNRFYLVAGFVVFFFSTLITAQRLGLIFSIQGIGLKTKELVALTFIGFFFNSFLPTGIGGDVIKAHFTAKKFQEKKIEIYISVLADRVSGLFAMLSISFVAMLIVGGNLVALKTKLLIAGLFILMILVFIIMTKKGIIQRFGFLMAIFRKLKIDSLAKRSYQVFNDFKNHKKISLKIMLISFVSQFVLTLSCFVLAKSLNIQSNFVMFIVFVPLTSIVSLVPSLGGIGPREGAFIILFSPIIGLVGATALALVWLAYYWLVNLIGGIVYLFSSYRNFESKKYVQ